MGGIDMEKFNLGEYLKNPDRKVVTRNGKDVRIICTDARGLYPVVALVECTDGSDCVYTYTIDGTLHLNTTTDDDLFFFAPEKREGWATIYGKFLTGEIFSTKEEAEESVKQCGTKDFVAIAKVEWEE